MPTTTSSDSGHGKGATSVAINGKGAEEKGSDLKNGQSASDSVIGVEMRLVSFTGLCLILSVNSDVPMYVVAATRWTRRLSWEATSTSSRRCSTTSRRQSTRGWSGRPSGGRCGNSAKDGLETKSLRWRHRVSTKDISSTTSPKLTEIDSQVSTRQCVMHESV